MAALTCSLCKLPVMTKQLSEGGPTYVYCRHCDNSNCPKCKDADANCTLCSSTEFRLYNGIGPGSIPPGGSMFRGLFGGR